MADILKFFKNNRDDIFKPVIVLLVICIVIPLALAVTNKITAARIAELDEKNETEAMKRLISAETYEKKELKADDETVVYTVASDGEEVRGYIFTVSAKGYGGDVSVMTAVNPDGSVKAVEILDVSNETPGLGQNAAKESFYSQFASKTADIELVKGTATGNQVNAVTGATITSKAVTKAVNEALGYCDTVIKATRWLNGKEAQ